VNVRELIVGVHRNQAGMLGKLAIMWLLVLALLGVAAVDAVSIGLTTFQLSDVATRAASDAAAAFRTGHDALEACGTARETVAAREPNLHMGEAFCQVDPVTGRVTVTLRTTAGTVLAGRLSFTRHYTKVVRSETNGPSDV
jgi:Tfp pilus assembly protein PilX